MPETPVAPSGPVTLPFQNLARLISQSTTFQSLMSAADADAALELINWPFWDAEDDTQDNPETLNNPVPGCTVTQLEGMMHDIYEDGTAAVELLMEIRATPRDDLTLRVNQWKHFGNQVGAILVEMRSYQGQQIGQYQMPDLIGPIHTIMPPSFTNQDYDADADSEAYLVAAYEVRIGV